MALQIIAAFVAVLIANANCFFGKDESNDWMNSLKNLKSNPQFQQFMKEHANLLPQARGSSKFADGSFAANPTQDKCDELKKDIEEVSGKPFDELLVEIKANVTRALNEASNMSRQQMSQKYNEYKMNFGAFKEQLVKKGYVSEDVERDIKACFATAFTTAFKGFDRKQAREPIPQS